MESQVEFHCLLVKLGKELVRTDVQELLHLFRLPGFKYYNFDSSFRTLFSLEALGHIDHFSPDKLQEALSNIGRRDLVQDVMEYKQSAVYKNTMEKEQSEKRLAANLRSQRKTSIVAVKELGTATKPIPMAENIITKKERRWRYMFTAALTHTEQIEKLTELLHKDVTHSDSSWRVEEILHLIQAAQEEAESLSKTLTRAILVLDRTLIKRNLDAGM